MSPRLDELVYATRDALAKRKRERPLAELEREADTRTRGAPVLRGAVPPGHVPHRGAQAPLALRRRRSARTPAARMWCAPTSAAARRRSRCSPRRRTSAARSPTCTRRARRPGCRSCARTSRSTPTSSTRQRRRAPTPCCWWWARWSRAQLTSLYRLAGDLDLDAIVEIHDDEELDARPRDRRRRDRNQQPRPRGLQRRHPAHVRPARRRAGRQGGGLRVGHPRTAGRSRSSSRWAWTRC